MTQLHHVRLQVEALEDRCTPSGFNLGIVHAFKGLDVAAQRFYPVDPSVPPIPIRVAPVFALNYGDSVDAVVPRGLNVALNHYPTDPSVTLSPIFHGLANAQPPTDVLPT